MAHRQLANVARRRPEKETGLGGSKSNRVIRYDGGAIHFAGVSIETRGDVDRYNHTAWIAPVDRLDYFAEFPFHRTTASGPEKGVHNQKVGCEMPPPAFCSSKISVELT